MGNCQQGYKDLCDGNLQRGRSGVNSGGSTRASGKAQPRSSCGSTEGKGLGGRPRPHRLSLKAGQGDQTSPGRLQWIRRVKSGGIPAKRTSEFLQQPDDTESNVAVREAGPATERARERLRNARRDARFRRQEGRLCAGLPGGQPGAEVPGLGARSSGAGAGAGRGHGSAGWAGGRGEGAGPGPAAMNLERLRSVSGSSLTRWVGRGRGPGSGDAGPGGARPCRPGLCPGRSPGGRRAPAFCGRPAGERGAPGVSASPARVGAPEPGPARPVQHTLRTERSRGVACELR